MFKPTLICSCSSSRPLLSLCKAKIESRPCDVLVQRLVNENHYVHHNIPMVGGKSDVWTNHWEVVRCRPGRVVKIHLNKEFPAYLEECTVRPITKPIKNTSVEKGRRCYYSILQTISESVLGFIVNTTCKFFITWFVNYLYSTSLVSSIKPCLCAPS